MNKKMDPLYMVGMVSLRQRAVEAQQAHDRFVMDVLKKMGLDPTKAYHIDDDSGEVTESIALPAKKGKP